MVYPRKTLVKYYYNTFFYTINFSLVVVIFKYYLQLLLEILFHILYYLLNIGYCIKFPRHV